MENKWQGVNRKEGPIHTLNSQLQLLFYITEKKVLIFFPKILKTINLLL